jgi:putative oxidoreductase
MKYAPTIVGALLGFLFVAFSLMVLLKLVPTPPPPADGSPIALFMGAFIPTGYITFVKIFELIGGILVAIPRTRNLGLLVLGPIIINIVAFHAFIAKGVGLFSPPLVLIVLLAAFLLWSERKAFAQLIRWRRSESIN